MSWRFANIDFSARDLSSYFSKTAVTVGETFFDKYMNTSIAERKPIEVFIGALVIIKIHSRIKVIKTTVLFTSPVT